MKIIALSEAKPYSPPLHHAMVALKLCDAGQFWCGLSHFLPGGGAEWAYDDSPTEKLYVILEGALTIRTREQTREVSNGEVIVELPMLILEQVEPKLAAHLEEKKKQEEEEKVVAMLGKLICVDKPIP